MKSFRAGIYAASGLIAGLLTPTILVPSNLSATPIITTSGGVVSIANLPGTMVGVSNGCINWNSAVACTAPTPVLDSVSSSDTSVFTSGSGPLDTIKTLPAGVGLPLVDFETIQSPLPGGVVHFDLTSIVVPGAFGNCMSSATGTSCNPGGGSPFTLLQGAGNQVTVSFNVNMNAYTGTSASGTTPYIGIFSTNLSGLLPNNTAVNIPDLLAFIGGGGTVTSTWSAQESPVPVSGTPEPGSTAMLLGGIGMIGLSMVARRNRNRA